jgi:hypothetical protein
MSEILNENAGVPPAGKSKKHAPRGRLKADPTQPRDPMQTAPLNGGDRCTAHGKHSKKPCKNPAILGGTVCRMHGGSAPQVIAAAEERLRALRVPAVIRLEELMLQKEFPSVAIAAVKDVLDRDGKLGKAKETQDIDLKHEIVIRWQ